MKHGQISLEYVFAIGSIILIFALVSLIVNLNNERNSVYSGWIKDRQKCLEIADAISQIYIMGEGSSIAIPSINYNITITKNSTVDLFSKITNKSLASCSSLAKVNSTVEKLDTIRIFNERGVIYIE